MPQLAYRRPKKTLFQLSIIPSGKKSEDTDHLTSPTEAAPVGQRRRTRGDRSRSIIPLISLSLSLSSALSGCYGDKHSSVHTDKANYNIQCNFITKCYKKLLSDVWLYMSSLHQYYSRFLILNKYYSFLPCHRLLFVRAPAKEPHDPKWNKIIQARIERHKTQFMKPVWQPIKYLSQLFARWPRSLRRDWECDVNHAWGRCSCCLCLHVVKTLRFLP